MIELQGRMRHLQAQAAQMQQQAAAAAGMPWPPNHPGMPQGAAAPPSNSSQEHPKVSSGQGAAGGVPQLPPQQTAGENAAGDKMSVNEEPTENQKMEPKVGNINSICPLKKQKTGILMDMANGDKLTCNHNFDTHSYPFLVD